MVQVVQVVRVVRIISSGDMHSGYIWFLWSNQSNHQEKLRCHARDGQTDGGRRKEDGKWKIGQCSVRPETAICLKIYGFSGQKLSTELSVSMFLFSQAQKMSFALKTQEAKHKDSSKKEIHCSAVGN